MKKRRCVAWIMALSMGMTGSAFAENVGSKVGSRESSAQEDQTQEVSTEDSVQRTNQSKEEGSVAQTKYFEVHYSGDWVYQEEYTYDEEQYSNASFSIPGEYGDEISVSISATIDAPLDYASDLYNYGLNAYEAIENQSYETVTIGGIAFCEGKQDYSREYMAYDEEANLYMDIFVYGDPYDTRVEELLEGIVFERVPYTAKKTPWYWDGEIYRPYETDTITVGDFSVRGEYLPIDSVYPTFDYGNAGIARCGTWYYLLTDGDVSEYRVENGEMIYQGEVEVGPDVSSIFGDPEGNLYTVGYLEPLEKIIDNGTETLMDSCGNLVLHPSGKKAAEYDYENNITVHDFETGTDEVHALEGISSIAQLYLTEDYAAVECWLENENVLKIYDKDWNEVMTFSASDTQDGYYGSVSAFAQTENGWVLFDSYAANTIFIGFDGAVYAEVPYSELFGVSYSANVDDVCMDADGSILAAISDERADGSCYETVVFRLSGF